MSDLIHREAARLIALEYISDSMERRLAIEAIRAIPAVQPKVKPLVWVMDEHGGFFAKGVNRTYSVFRLALDQATWGAIGVPDTSTDSQFVMDRCQADYESCILSALEPAVQPDAAQCCMCGKKGLSTEEDNGPECELSDGRWVCSEDCWNDALEPDAAGLMSAGGGAGWQPIETAPKDRVVDLWSSRGFRYTDAFWDITEYRLPDDPRPMEYGWTDKNHHGSIEEGGPYTHWRYPPEPPATEGI